MKSVKSFSISYLRQSVLVVYSHFLILCIEIKSYCLTFVRTSRPNTFTLWRIYLYQKREEREREREERETDDILIWGLHIRSSQHCGSDKKQAWELEVVLYFRRLVLHITTCHSTVVNLGGHMDIAGSNSKYQETYSQQFLTLGKSHSINSWKSSGLLNLPNFEWISVTRVRMRMRTIWFARVECLAPSVFVSQVSVCEKRSGGEQYNK